MFDLIREIAQTLRNNKLRTFLTGFAVAWGIFMLIILLGMARGVTNSFQANRSGESASSLSVNSGYTRKAYRGLQEGRRIQPDINDIRSIPDALPEYVKKATAYKFLSATNLSTSRDYVNARLEGVYPEEQKVDDVKINYGRFINAADLREERKVVVINEENAEVLFGDASKAVGQRVDAYGLSWLVVGVYSHRWERAVYIPFNTAMRLSDDNLKLGNIRVQLNEISTEEEAEEAEQAVRAQLAQNHTFDPSDKSAMYIYNRFKSYLRESSAFNILNSAIWIIGIFTLLSGIVGVSNIMFVSVRERTHEIGIRRAIGAKPRSVLMQIVTESVAITTLFGYIGIVLGMMIMQTVNTFVPENDVIKNPTISLSIAIEVTILLIIAGALAGLFPAIKATKVKPVEALRDE